MTLLDAPKFDAVGERRKTVILYSAAATFFVLIVGFWLVAGRPVDWPWHWMASLRGRMAVNTFFEDVEKNDLNAAYAVWTHDKDWQQHRPQHTAYPFERFEEDWSPASHENEYGVISSHRIAAVKMHGNVLMLGIFVNGRKSKAINLDYDPTDHTLHFSPDYIRFMEGPGGIS